MRNLYIIFLLIAVFTRDAEANCLEVSLTGTQGGPPITPGLAGSGTLVRYGGAANGCSDILLQFDAGRGTAMRLSELGVSTRQLDAVFITHLHSDHSEGLAGIMQFRWHAVGDPLDIVCSADAHVDVPAPGRTMSCGAYLEHIGDPFIEAGEIKQRSLENKKREPGGPAALTRYVPVDQPLPTTPEVVWKQGDVTVSAIGSTHIPGHVSYRVDTPAGSVVVGGDAGNSKPKPPRENSTSETVELLAQGADILVHSTMHPVLEPGGGSNIPPRVYYRQSTAGDLGAMAQRAGVEHLMLTHLIPTLGVKSHGLFSIPGGPLTEADYETAARDGGFKGTVHVGKDLMTLRLPAEPGAGK